LQQDEHKQKHADDNLGPPAGQGSVEDDVGLHQSLQHDADEGARDKAVAAGQKRAADDDGGDGVKLDAQRVQTEYPAEV
jgi:hypothetical protein